MKINPGWRPLSQERTRQELGNRPVQMKSFSDIMGQQDQERTNEQLHKKMQDIYNQGERLARSMTVRELKLYRQKVKQFLEDTVSRGIRLKDTKGWDRRGRTKRYKLLEEVDSRLILMGEELLETEQGRIELLNRVGEIRGILINLLF
ncbi:YaaR family protein [Paenibacillus tarimensis]